MTEIRDKTSKDSPFQKKNSKQIGLLTDRIDQITASVSIVCAGAKFASCQFSICFPSTCVMRKVLAYLYMSPLRRPDMPVKIKLACQSNPSFSRSQNNGSPRSGDQVDYSHMKIKRRPMIHSRDKPLIQILDVRGRPTPIPREKLHTHCAPGPRVPHREPEIVLGNVRTLGFGTGRCVSGGRGQRDVRVATLVEQGNAQGVVGEVLEAGGFEEAGCVVAVGDGAAGEVGGLGEVFPELAEGGGVLWGAGGVVAAGLPVDFD